LTLSPSNYVNSFKIFLTMLKTNQSLIKESPGILELPVASVSRSFIETFKRVNENFDENRQKFLIMQARILKEIQKMFENQFRGTCYIVEAIVDLQSYLRNSTLNPKLTDILNKLKSSLWSELSSSNFYSAFFTKLKGPSNIEFSLDLCTEIFDKIKESEEFLTVAMSKDKTSNFCLLTAQFIAENPEIIQTNPMIFSQTIEKITQVFCMARNIKFTEREIIKSIVSDDFWIGEVSFEIFREYLKIVDSDQEIAEKFVFFQKLLKKLWNPSVSLSTRAQFRVAEIVLFIGNHHVAVAKQHIVDKNSLAVLMNYSKPDCQEKFRNSVELISGDPSVGNYYSLIASTKALGFGEAELSQETLEKLCVLIKMTENCDWAVNSNLVVNIMQTILGTRDKKQKQILLLRFNSALHSDETKPFEVKLKLLELLFSFIPSAKVQEGLRKLLVRELNKLLIEGPDRIRKLILDKLHESAGNECQ
jgi:hypothetical protein